jgi:ABC-2 type transport system ATP-binding protein
MLEVKGLYKSLGGREILKDIDLSLKPGCIFGLVGENGAGKTTLIKCLTGVYRPDKGIASINGQQIYDNPGAKENIGYIADQNQYFPAYRITELLSLYSLAYPAFSRERFEKLNQTFDLPVKTRVRALSKGMQMRLTLMLSLSIWPQVLILDEPTSGLDPIAKRDVTNLLLEEVESRGVTILISSHHLGDLERICDTIGIIAAGEMKANHSLEEMKTKMRKLQVVYSGAAPTDLAQWPEVLAVESVGRVHYVVTKQYGEALLGRLRQTKPLLMEEMPLGLEDMFIYAAKEGYQS